MEAEQELKYKSFCVLGLAEMHGSSNIHLVSPKSTSFP